jgi:hypothetical protein
MLIANRSLNLRTKDGNVQIPVRLFSPEQGAGGSWNCRYEIDWPDGKWAMEAGGFDALQAILMAFYMIGSEIYTSNYHKAGQLSFQEPGNGYGFPVPAPLRDLLQGSDKEFF